MAVSTSNRYDAMVSDFNALVCQPLVRDLGYRLKQIEPNEDGGGVLVAVPVGADGVVTPEAALAQRRFSDLRDGVEALLSESPFGSNVFIMMQYANSDRCRAIEAHIKKALDARGLRGYLARDRQLLDDLLDNVCAYMVACKYGVVVFDPADESDFNPNVSLEHGFMMAWGRRCLLLKDSRLKSLHADVCGRLYKEFEHDHLASIEALVTEWLAHVLPVTPPGGGPPET
jgi:hypothetical protein